MAWRQIGVKPLPEPMITVIHDVARWRIILFVNELGHRMFDAKPLPEPIPTLWNKLQQNFGNFCKMAAFLFWPQCVKDELRMLQ